MPHNQPVGIYAQNLFKILRLCDVRQRDVMEALGLSRAEISDWARGYRPVSPKHYDALMAQIREAIAKRQEQHYHAMEGDAVAKAWWEGEGAVDVGTSELRYLFPDPPTHTSAALAAWWDWHTKVCEAWEAWDVERQEPWLKDELNQIFGQLATFHQADGEHLEQLVDDPRQRAKVRRLIEQSLMILRRQERLDTRPRADLWKQNLARTQQALVS